MEVPRDREGEFATELFERYKGTTSDVEEAVLEMYLSGISVRKIAGVTEALSRVKVGKDAVSCIVRRLEEEQREWPERSLTQIPRGEGAWRADRYGMEDGQAHGEFLHVNDLADTCVFLAESYSGGVPLHRCR